MKRNIILILAIISGLFLPVSSSAFTLDENVKQFVKNNPDGNKYEFAKAFISSLEYIKTNVERNEATPVISPQDLYDDKRLSDLNDNYTLDNVNWRIAKNLLKKYLTPDNGLELKAADLFTKMCDEQIELNSREKKWLAMIEDYKAKGKMANFDQQKFLNDIQAIASGRKESLKKMLESAIVAAKVLISNKQNIYGELEKLGITAKQRDNLIYKIDNFYGDKYEGPLRQGQSFLEASVSVLKDILNDYSWHSLDE